MTQTASGHRSARPGRRGLLILSILAAAAAALGLYLSMDSADRAKAAFPGAHERNGKIVFACGSKICTVKPNGTRRHQLPRIGFYPRWSPDGRRIVYTLWPRRGGKPATYIMRGNGTGRHRVTPPRGLGDREPAWSPDGKKIVFVRRFTNGAEGLFTVDARGKTRPRRLILSEAQKYGPSWSPDGTTIVFALEYGRRFDIFTIDARGKAKPRRLTHDERRTDLDPDWSPNGKKIVFVGVYRTGVSWIYTINANGTGQRNLLDEAGVYGSEPAWSPDGRKIVFVGSNENKYLGIFTMRANGQGALAGLNLDANDRSPDWQPR